MNETNATWFSQKVGFDPLHLASCSLVVLNFTAAPSKSGDLCLWWSSTLGIPGAPFSLLGQVASSDNPSEQHCTYVHWSPQTQRTLSYFGLPPLAGGTSLPPSLSVHVRTCRAHRPAGNRTREGVKSCHGRTGFTLNRHHGSPFGCRLAFRDIDTVLSVYSN